VTPERNQASLQESTAGTLVQADWAVAGDRAGLRAAALALCCALLATWTGAVPWRDALGHPLGEADNHRWMWWRAVAELSGHSGPWANLPVGEPLPVMDPANLVFYLPGAMFDPVLGWNIAALLLVALSGVGAWALAVELGAGEGAPVAVAAGACSPFLAGVLDFGITESWGVGWLALHTALLLRFGRTGRLAAALGAGLCLGAVGLSGWYQALFGLMVELPLVVWAVRRGGALRLPGLLGQGGLGLAMTLPSFLAFLEQRGLWAHRFVYAVAPSPPPPRPDWAHLPILGTDLLNLVLPRLDADAPSKAAYLSLAVLALVALGLWRRPSRVGALLAIAALPLLLALGPWPTVAGSPVGLLGPAGWLQRLDPDLLAVSHWYRAVGAAIPFLAAAAAIGAAGLSPRWRRVAVAVVIADGLLLGPTAWPRHRITDDTPPLLLELAARVADDAPRGVVQLPFDNGRRMFSTEPARSYDRWQIRHGLPRSESYEGGDAVLARSDLVAGWQEATGLASTLPPEQRTDRRVAGPLTDPARVAAELARLRGWGYRFVVLHRDRAPEPDAAEAAIQAVLGPGERVGDSVAWELSSGGG